jgi:hypothetical protein
VQHIAGGKLSCSSALSAKPIVRIIDSRAAANGECGPLTRRIPVHDLARLNTMLSLSLIAGP